MICVLTSIGLLGQDQHFSHIYETALFYNPAATGKYQGDWRVMNTYRSQWKQIDAPYQSNALGFDKQFYHYTRKASAGLLYVNDRSGIIPLNSNKIYLSGAYHLPIKKHRIHIGGQLGLVLKSIDVNAQSFPNQFNWDIGSFDSSLPNEETNLNNSFSYLDFNIGLIYGFQMNKIYPEIGLAVFHLNRPKDNFTIEKEKLPARFQGNVSISFNPVKFLRLKPYTFISHHNKASEILTGMDIYFNIGKGEGAAFKHFYLGGLVRNGINRNTDAMIAKFGFNLKNVDVGFSYDFNISDLQQDSSNNGAIELSLVYTRPSSRQTNIQVPCDRY